MLDWRSGVPQSFGPVASSRACLLAMTAVGLIGGGLAVDQSTVNPLSLPSISRLGIDPRAGVILNATLIGLGLGMLALGACLRTALAVLCADGPARRPASTLIPGGFVVAGIGFLLTGAFTIEGPTSTVVHNLAGFSTPIVLMGSLIGARVALGSLGAAFDGLAVVVVAGSASLFASASAWRLMPYPMMELSCFALIGTWLWLFEARLHRAGAGAQKERQ